MKQRIITFANHKGGVSKTTSTASIGACMAQMGKKVLLIDLDGQANLTLYFIPNEDDIETSIFDALVDGAPLPVKHIRENLDLVPSSLEMASAEIALTNLLAREQLLCRLLDPIKQDYDYILIDCPPSLGLVTLNALTAADTVLVPVQCEYFALEGMEQLFHTIGLVQKRLNPELEIEGVVFTMYDSRTNLSLEVVEEVKKVLKPSMYSAIIPRNVRLGEAPSYGLPITIYDSKSKGAESYRALAEQVINKEWK